MIKEDYVSFEVAKLLKEKGFDVPCDSYYFTGNNQLQIEFNFENDWNNTWEHAYTRPTHQKAMKWLREKHNIVIEINLDDYMTAEDGSLKVWYSYTIWTFIQHLGETGLVDSRYEDRAYWQENVKVGQTYEESCEAALKYTLENLIL